jgi:Ca-activated chloride channel family protein
MKKQLIITLLAGLALLQTSPAKSGPLTFQAELSHPLLPAGEKQTAYLKVSVTGGNIPDESLRAPINLAIVLDRSGSMSGAKMERAREAAKLAVSRLQANDIVSIVSYDDVVEVIVPATKLTDKEAVYGAIDELSSRGSTALFAGVSKGAEELRKFKNKEAVNRIILLSDGLANVGPQSPRELGQLGASLGGEGISVTTIGLGNGYNEDLMNQLALNSDGNHSFVETPAELAQVFDQELGDLLSVVASNLSLEVQLAEGIRPVRALGRKADIDGQTVTVSFNQLYAEQDKFLLLEIETPASESSQDLLIAEAKVRYQDLVSEKSSEATVRNVARVVEDKERVAQSANREVMIAATGFLATERSAAAVKLRDEGKVEEAKVVIRENRITLEKEAKVWDSEELAKQALYNQSDLEEVDGANWGAKRKSMIQRRNEKVTQNKGYRSKD